MLIEQWEDGIDVPQEWVTQLDGSSLLQDVEARISLALPLDYERRKRHRFPLMVVVMCEDHMGAITELSRLMSDTREINSMLLVGIVLKKENMASAAAIQSLLLTRLIPRIVYDYRVDENRIALFAHGAAVDLCLGTLGAAHSSVTHFIFSGSSVAAFQQLRTLASVACYLKECSLLLIHDGKILVEEHGDVSLPSVSPPWPASHSTNNGEQGQGSESAVTAMAVALQKIWPTGREYGQEMTLLANPIMLKLAKALRPLISRLKPAPAMRLDVASGAIRYCEDLQREFELFISLPASYAHDTDRVYPLVLALDANYCFASVAEIARNLAESGEMEECIVVGLGVPKREGAVAFALRRLEEFSPPSPGYAFSDQLGRILTTLYCLNGMKLQAHFGKASLLFRFIADTVLPSLLAKYRVDETRLGLLGHSAGGTFVGYALHQPDSPFSDYICSSPGLSISDSWLLKTAKDIPDSIPSRRIFLSTGSLEHGNAFNNVAGIPLTASYASALAEHPSLTTRYTEFAGESHSSVLPNVITQGLRSLWPAQGLNLITTPAAEPALTQKVI